MGNMCPGDTPIRLKVSSMPNWVPETPNYRKFRGQSSRLGELLVTAQVRNNYHFSIRAARSEIRVALTVLNEVVHCLLHPNYKLKLEAIIVDVFDHQQDSVMASVSSQQGSRLTLRAVPFKGYSSLAFKIGVHQIWLNRKLAATNGLLALKDAFVYGVNPDKQVLLMLFERVETNLFNIAEYRQLSRWPWSKHQKIQIMCQLMATVSKMHDNNIFHRDIRPSNCYFQSNRYCLGGLADAKLQSLPQAAEDDLQTVCGIEEYSYDKLKQLIKGQQQVGLYNLRVSDYNGLRNILVLLETLDPLVAFQEPHFTDEIFSQIHSKLKSLQPLLEIIRFAREKSELQIESLPLVEDAEISQLAVALLARRHHKAFQAYQFAFYESMGYHQQFSELAHQRLELNNEFGRPLDNAPILKHLGDFYKEKGARSTEYFINACVLFCRKTELAIKYKQFSQASMHLAQAEETYLKFSDNHESTANLVEIKRLKMVLLAYSNDPKEAQLARPQMTKLVAYAADQLLPTERQLKLLLSSATVLRVGGEGDLAVQRLRTGLAICENSGAFESPTSCLLVKSDFLYELGWTQLTEIRQKHDPQRKTSEQSYSPQLKGSAETSLRSALRIRQHQSKNAYEIVQCLTALGSYYLILDEYSESKTCYQRAITHLQNIKSQLPRSVIAEAYYGLGSVNYRSNDFSQAQRCYKEAIELLKKQPSEKYWLHCIEGNLGLTLLQRENLKAGQQLLEKAQNYIRAQRGQKHYDYAFLQWQLNKIKQK